MSDPLVHIFKKKDWKTSDAYFWDWLREDNAAWSDLKYEWIAKSEYGDQIIITQKSPILKGSAVYMHGPDVSGPDSPNPDWPDSVLYLGSSVEEWRVRMETYGDEYSVIPGSIDELLENPDEYRELYRKLNPGLNW